MVNKKSFLIQVVKNNQYFCFVDKFLHYGLKNSIFLLLDAVVVKSLYWINFSRYSDQRATERNRNQKNTNFYTGVIDSPLYGNSHDQKS